MAFSNDWDVCYQSNTHMSVWPWSDLVSLVFRHGGSTPDNRRRVLELGCGAGANIPFLTAWTQQYHGLEGSPAIVSQLHSRFPALREKIRVADFTETFEFDGDFDLVVDRASVTHNDTRSIQKVLGMVWNKLAPEGLFIGVDWFSSRHSDFRLGVSIDDHTKTQLETGQFVGVGQVHFSDEAHLRQLFSNFEILLLEEKTVRRRQPADDHLFASWNIVARKSDG